MFAINSHTATPAGRWNLLVGNIPTLWASRRVISYDHLISLDGLYSMSLLNPSLYLLTDFHVFGLMTLAFRI